MQGMRQGNDRGTQYRYGIYVYNDEKRQVALSIMSHYQQQINNAALGKITTEILDTPEFYYAEDYHQQYLSKNPNGYCGPGGVDVMY